MYTIQSLKKEDIGLIKEEWKTLERGKDMTYFQSFEWNEMLTHYAPANNWWLESLFFLVKKGEAAVLIAPVWIIKHDYKLINKKGCYTFARYEWSDYVNYIYEDLDSDALEYLFEHIRTKYGIERFSMNNLKEETSLYRYIKATKKGVLDSQATCVQLILPNSIEDYSAMLSKNSRQNIRTAYNRLRKDEVKVEVKYDDSQIDKSVCIELREQRCDIKAKKKKYNFGRLKSWFIETALLFKMRPYIPIVSDKNSRFLSFYASNELKAFFNYGVNEHVATIYAMSAGFDLKYSKYSPGLIAMYEFIQNKIVENKIKVIDFTRGTEFYKYALGGTEHYIHNITFTL